MEQKSKFPVWLWVSIFLLIAIIILLFKDCSGNKEATYKQVSYKTGTYVQSGFKLGRERVLAVDTVKTKAVKKEVSSKKKIKKNITLSDDKKDTVRVYNTSEDTLRFRGLTITISDTMQGDSIYRRAKLVGVDSTFYVNTTTVRTDTLFMSKTDTVFVKEKGLGWKRFKQGVAAGAGVVAAGVAFVVLSK